ncbi:MAG: hypothetical protein R2877_02850 [Bdellovibrionota bacterium]
MKKLMTLAANNESFIQFEKEYQKQRDQITNRSPQAKRSRRKIGSKKCGAGRGKKNDGRQAV